jgi:hypothetical protein
MTTCKVNPLCFCVLSEGGVATSKKQKRLPHATCEGGIQVSWALSSRPHCCNIQLH